MRSGLSDSVLRSVRTVLARICNCATRKMGNGKRLANLDEDGAQLRQGGPQNGSTCSFASWQGFLRMPQIPGRPELTQDPPKSAIPRGITNAPKKEQRTGTAESLRPAPGDLGRPRAEEVQENSTVELPRKWESWTASAISASPPLFPLSETVLGSAS